jgi:hypothetical protein
MYIDVNLQIERLKKEQEFDTYLEAVSFFLENETDEEPIRVAKLLNKKIIEEIQQEAGALGMLKTDEPAITVL